MAKAAVVTRAVTPGRPWRRRPSSVPPSPRVVAAGASEADASLLMMKVVVLAPW